jgi:hypothetical protein
MKDREKERLIKEMDRRTRLWEGKRSDAKRRIEIGNEDTIAKTDLQVAENTLKTLEEQEKEILGERAYKHLEKKPTEQFKKQIVAKKGKEPAKEEIGAN